jgi:hypothetical protein
MRVDIAGRTRNIHLSPSRALQPLFEAVANSIFSIQDAGIADGRITITVRRSPEGQKGLYGGDLRPVVDFIVEDNGVGFNEINFD